MRRREESYIEALKAIPKDRRRKNVKRLSAEMWGKYKWYIISMFFVSVAMNATATMIPFFTQKLLDDAWDKSSVFGGTLLSVSIIFGFFILINAVATFINRKMFLIFEQKVEYGLKDIIFEKTMHIKTDNFDKNNEGYFMGVIKRDPFFVAQMVHHGPRNLFEGTITLSLSITFVFLISWIAGVVAIFLIIITVSISVFYKIKFNKQFSIIREKGDVYSKQITNDIVGIREIKNYVAYDQIFKNTELAAKDLQKANKDDYKIGAKWQGWNAFAISLFMISFILVGALGFDGGSATPGQFAALVMYAGTIANPVNNFIAFYEVLFKGEVALDKYYIFIDQEDEQDELPSMGDIRGSISIKDLHLTLNNVDILKGINLEIFEGEKIGIVGETGSGKSTLFKTLIGYYKPTSGTIELDGKNIWEHSLYSLRSNISYMAQDPFISFSNIKDNITLGLSNDQFTDDEYNSAIKKSELNEFISNLPEGENTPVGPKGITLSGGQRQRIAISRMFLRKNYLLLFDEATSSLDNKTEDIIQNNIDIFTKGKTSITIAHRLSTLDKVDRIIVLENGKVAEIGSRQTLISNRGAFWRYLTAHSGDEAKAPKPEDNVNKLGGTHE